MSSKMRNWLFGGVMGLVVAGLAGCDDKPEPVKAAPQPVQQTTPAGPPASVSIGEPKVQSAVSAPPPGSSAALAMPSPTAPGGGAAAMEVPSKDALEAVTQAVQSFFINKERAPKNLEELVASGFLRKLPTPPAGKKYVYDPEKANIALADQ